MEANLHAFLSIAKWCHHEQALGLLEQEFEVNIKLLVLTRESRMLEAELRALDRLAVYLEAHGQVAAHTIATGLCWHTYFAYSCAYDVVWSCLLFDLLARMRQR